MSRPFQSKNKDLVNLEVVTADKVWEKDKKGKPKLKKDLGIFGRIDKGTSSFITSTNLTGGNHKFVEDTSNLSTKTKNEVVKLLKTEGKRVVYLVRKKAHFKQVGIKKNGGIPET
ncbi:MAG: hypothetical protein IJW64_00525 [Clostridia bacterium]|nr:hypothetical protein [Clostridia bacterium]